MAYSAALTAFAQSVYLTIKNRYYDDIEDTDGQTLISQVIDWANLYFDELENTLDSSGRPVYWNWLLTPNDNLGTVSSGVTSITLPGSVRDLVALPGRTIEIQVAGKTVGTWSVVYPGQMGRNSVEKTVAKVGGLLVFSQPVSDYENGGTVVGDAVGSIPRLSDSNEQALSLVKPRQLLVLGVAKNASLPDIVQGGLSPSFVQKYNDLLQSAIQFNNFSSQADTNTQEDFGFITGVGF